MKREKSGDGAVKSRRRVPLQPGEHCNRCLSRGIVCVPPAAGDGVLACQACRRDRTKCVVPDHDFDVDMTAGSDAHASSSIRVPIATTSEGSGAGRWMESMLADIRDEITEVRDVLERIVAEQESLAASSTAGTTAIMIQTLIGYREFVLRHPIESQEALVADLTTQLGLILNRQIDLTPMLFSPLGAYPGAPSEGSRRGGSPSGPDDTGPAAGSSSAGNL